VGDHANAFRFSCDDDTCSTFTGLVEQGDADSELDDEIVRVGASANTAPSISLENVGTPSVHILAMHDDSACLSGTAKAMYDEFKWNGGYTSLLATLAVESVASPCSQEWNHGLLGFNAVDASFFAGWTQRIGLSEDVFTAARDVNSAPWDSPEAVLTASDSQHVSFAFGPNGNFRILYGDKAGSDSIVFGDGINEITLDGSGGGDWPSLALDASGVNPHWRAVWAATQNSSPFDPVILASSCQVGTGCLDTPPYDDWAAVTNPFTRSDADTIRGLEIRVASDGSRHLLWEDNLISGIGKVWYARYCPNSGWLAAIQPWESNNQNGDAGDDGDQWLDVGRPHIAFTEVNGEHVVHIVLADRGKDDGAAAAQDLTDGNVIWAHRSWACS
jgi:hypothetical protein